MDGDLRGVFFHVKDITKVTSISGTSVTGSQVGTNSVYDLGNGVTMIGGGGDPRLFDIGVLIGTSSASQGDDIRTTTFTVHGITLADIDYTQEFGVRLQTVGPAGASIEKRGDSSKVFGLPTC